MNFEATPTRVVDVRLQAGQILIVLDHENEGSAINDASARNGVNTVMSLSLETGERRWQTQLPGGVITGVSGSAEHLVIESTAGSKAGLWAI